MDNERKRLIIGLGNPGDAYKKTRHNVGFEVVSTLAQKNGWSFKHAAHMFGELAQGVVDDTQILVLKPMTFMNESGIAVRRCVEYYKVPLDSLIVVSDDAALPSGTIRMRTKGSCGGHNGLYSIETHLNTQHYARLRVGIGAPVHVEMKDHVLSGFSAEEIPLMEEAASQAVRVLELWVLAGIAAAMQAANALAKHENKKENNNDQAKETSL